MAKKVAKKVVVKKTAKKKVAQPIKKVEKKQKPIVAKETDIVVHNPSNPMQSFVVASEFADDEQIEGELMGKAMEHYVYSFSQDGKPVTGMTVAGVNEMSRLLTRKKDSGIKIRIVPDSIKIERDVVEGGVKGISVTLLAENMISGETAIGAKFEPYEKPKRGGGSYANTFALEKAVSKAERNAKRKLIPERVAIEMIKKFVKDGSVKELAPVNPPVDAKTIVQPAGVDYLSKLISMVSKEARIRVTKDTTPDDWKKIVETYNLYTGENIRSLKVSQERAKKMLWDFMNSPLMINS